MNEKSKNAIQVKKRKKSFGVAADAEQKKIYKNHLNGFAVCSCVCNANDDDEEGQKNSTEKKWWHQ